MLSLVHLYSKYDNDKRVFIVDPQALENSKFLQLLIDEEQDPNNDQDKNNFTLDIGYSTLKIIVEYWNNEINRMEFLNKKTLEELSLIFSASDYLQDDILMNQCGSVISKRLESSSIESFIEKFKVVNRL